MGFNSRQSARLEAYRERQRAAGLVSERYPEVESIRLEAVFHDTDGRPIQRRTKIIAGDQFALFELPCPVEGCTLSLDEIIGKAIASHGKRRTGAIQCSGENQETGVTMPPHQMDYAITIRYRKPEKKQSTSKGKRAARTAPKARKSEASATSARRRSQPGSQKKQTSKRAAAATRKKTAAKSASRTATKKAATKKTAARKTQAAKKASRTKSTADASKSRARSTKSARKATSASKKKVAASTASSGRKSTGRTTKTRRKAASSGKTSSGKVAAKVTGRSTRTRATRAVASSTSARGTTSRRRRAG